MSSSGKIRWRQFIEEALIGASAIALAFTAIYVTAEPILAAVALVGIALLVELHVRTQSADEPGSQPLRPPAEPEAARPEPQAVTGFDAAIFDAATA